MGELAEYIADMPFAQRAQLQGRDQRVAVLQQMVDRRVLLHEAEKAGIEVSPDDMVATLRVLLQMQGDKRAQSASADELRALMDPDHQDPDTPTDTVLIEYGQTEDDIKAMHAEQRMEKIHLRQRVKEETLIRKLLDKEVFDKFEMTESDLREFYNANIDMMKVPEGIRFRFMSLPTKKAADDILEQVKEGKSFEQIVKDTGGSTAMELPNYLPISKIPEDIREPLAHTEPGKIAGPLLRGDNQYDLVQIIDHRKEGVMPFEAVKDQIERAATMAKREKMQKEYITRLRKNYGVVLFPDNVIAATRLDSQNH